MKALVFIAFFILAFRELPGQPELIIIPNKKTSEYYYARYEIPKGAGGAAWLLLDTQGLEFSYNISDSPPKSWRKEIGHWFINSDTILFVINRKVPQSHAGKIPAGRKYIPLIVKLSGTSKTLPYWRERQLLVEANLIFLLDAERKELTGFAAGLLEYVEKRLEAAKIDHDEIFEVVDVVGRLAREWCEKEQVPYTQKVYFNGNLQKNY